MRIANRGFLSESLRISLKSANLVRLFLLFIILISYLLDFEMNIIFGRVLLCNDLAGAADYN